MSLQTLFTPARCRVVGGIALAVLVMAVPAHAASPWEDAIDQLARAVTGPIARGLGLVAIVVGGLMWAFGEGTKHTIAGILFGVGMAIGAANFMTWLFG